MQSSVPDPTKIDELQHIPQRILLKKKVLECIEIVSIGDDFNAIKNILIFSNKTKRA